MDYAEIDEDNCGLEKELIDNSIGEICQQVLETAQWDEKMVPIWQNQIIEQVMKRLISEKMPYKYIVTCMLVQKSDSTLQSACSVNWES